MIRVRLYEEEDWKDVIETNGCDGAWEKKFEECLICPDWEKGSKPPLRDAESTRLLEEGYHVSFVSDEDWYTVEEGNMKCPVSEIGSYAKFALTVIHYSRLGIYTEWGFCEEEALKVLADLPFDILLAVRTDRLYKDVYDKLWFWKTDFLIENCPYNDRSIEVTVKKEKLEDKEFYTRVSTHLYVGKNGNFYAFRFDAGAIFHYRWRNDIKGIIEYIDSLENESVTFGDISRTYDVFELGKRLKQDENALVDLEYLVDRRYFDRRAHEEGWLKKSEYGDLIAPFNGGSDYEEYWYFRDNYEKYLYFRNIFRIVVHLDTAPKEMSYRRGVELQVDKKSDGTYRIYDNVTLKHPEFHHLVRYAIEERSSERESIMIIVDVNGDRGIDSTNDQAIYSASDIVRGTVYGFHITEDRVGIYDGYQALRLFGAALKKAYNSGRCTVDD